MCANLQVHRSNGLASRVQTDRQTDRQTHTHGTENITSSANAGDNDFNMGPSSLTKLEKLHRRSKGSQCMQWL